jgi:hypothetical protein
MTRVESTPLRRRWTFWQWPVVWSLAALALALGVVGFARQQAKEPLSFLDCLYLSLHLFIFNSNVTGPLNWPLQVARFLAPAVAAYTAAQALLAIFHEQLFMLRLRFWRGHVIVCGLGRTGYTIAADFLRCGRKVVVIEEESECDWIGACENLGALVLIGDATDASLLRLARASHAETVVVVCGDDGTNVEIAIRACAVKGEPQSSTSPLRCHVHIVDDDLRSLFKAHRVFTDTGDFFKVSLFNIYDTSARVLFQRHPLDRERLGVEDPRVVHLIVIGFGQMGESLVLQAAKIGHYANGRRLRVTVVDQFAERRRRSFYLRNPQFDQVCDINFIELAGDDPELLGKVAAWCAEADTLSTLAVCFDADARCLSFALSLLPVVRDRRVPVLLRMTTSGGLTTLLDSDATRLRLGGVVHPFAVIQLDSQHGASLMSQPDDAAAAIHDDYVRRRRREGQTADTNPAVCPWDDLDDDLKDSNRQQADHLAVKLRFLGWAGVAPGSGDLSPDEVETLARMEHARWNAERFLAGWRFAPGKKNIDAKTSPHLVEWGELPEEIKEYDREAVRNISAWVRAMKQTQKALRR